MNGNKLKQGTKDRLVRCGEAAVKALGLDEDNDAPSDVRERIESLQADLDKADRWAAYNHSCALCGDIPSSEEEFHERVEAALKARKAKETADGNSEQG